MNFPTKETSGLAVLDIICGERIILVIRRWSIVKEGVVCQRKAKFDMTDTEFCRVLAPNNNEAPRACVVIP